MKIHQCITRFLLLVPLFCWVQVAFTQEKVLSPYEGTWALTLPHNGFNDAGWLEVKQADGYIDASLLWYGGSVTPVDHAYLNANDLFITMTRQRQIGEITRRITRRAEMHLENDVLQGVMYIPNLDGSGIERFSFTGKKLPPDPPKPDLSSLEFGSPINLLDQHSLKGWSLIGKKSQNGWSVENGVLKNNPVQPENGEHLRYGNLRTDAEFTDFALSLEVNVPANNNSGIYLRGIYEIQVVDSYGKALDSHNMGALYSRITPAVAAEKPAGEWQKVEIVLVDRHVTVELNGKKIIDNQPVRGCTGGALSSDEFKPGPIYLQGDHGSVSYRNIVLTPIN